MRDVVHATLTWNERWESTTVGELDIRISGTTCCRRVFGSPFPIDQQVDPEYVKPIHTQGDVEEVTCLACRKVLEAMR